MSEGRGIGGGMHARIFLRRFELELELSRPVPSGVFSCRHLLLPLSALAIHRSISKCKDMGGIANSTYQQPTMYTYIRPIICRSCRLNIQSHSGCHTWNLTTPHTANLNLLSSFRSDILPYAGVPSRLDMYMAKKQKMHGQRTGTLKLDQGTSSRLAKHKPRFRRQS
jgi:hypothetical protein